MNGALLWIFGLFICSLTLGQSLQQFAEPDRGDEPHGLTAIIEHCGEDYFYKQLSVISAGEDLGLEFWRNLHEGLWIPVRVSNDLDYLNSVGFQSCVILCLPIGKVIKFFETVDRYSWTPNNIYVIHTSDVAPMGKESRKISYEDVWSSSAAGLWKTQSAHKLILSKNGRNLFYDPFAPSTSLRDRKSWIFNGTELPENFFGAPKDLGSSADLLKRRDTFEGYEADVALFPYIAALRDEDGIWSGLEVKAMDEICKRMNITPRVFAPAEKFGWIDNGKFFGTLGRLVGHQSKLAFNGFFVKNYGTRKLEFTTYLSTDKICVIVPKRARVPEYLLIVRIFSIHSWLLIFVGNSFVASTYAGMTSVHFPGLARKGKSKKSKIFEKFLPPKAKATSCRWSLTRVQRLLGTWIFLCLYPMKTRAEWLGERLHVACGLMLGIVIGGCFTSQLASSFSRPAFLQNIETLEELDNSGLEILTSFPNLLYDVFTHTDSSARSNLQMKLKLKNASEIETEVLEKRNAGYLDRKDSLTLAKNPNEKLHVLSEYPREYHLAYPILKGSPFLQRLNAIIGRLQGAGLYAKWFSDMTQQLKNDQSQKPVVIRLPHLYIPFFLLFIGLGIAGGIFFSELNGPSSV